jgi:hypothetical protein
MDTEAASTEAVSLTATIEVIKRKHYLAILQKYSKMKEMNY